MCTLIHMQIHAQLLHVVSLCASNGRRSAASFWRLGCTVGRNWVVWLLIGLFLSVTAATPGIRNPPPLREVHPCLVTCGVQSPDLSPPDTRQIVQFFATESVPTRVEFHSQTRPSSCPMDLAWLVRSPPLDRAELRCVSVVAVSDSRFIRSGGG